MGNPQLSVFAKELIFTYELDKEDFTDKYDGVLLCEGTLSSVDVLLYQSVYPSLKVIPVGGWSDVMKLQPMIRKRLRHHGVKVFGIIDRDSRTKGEIKKLSEKGIYCTKLPFIENIISCPEVIKLFAENKHRDGNSLLNTVQKELMFILSRKLVDALPLNIPITEDEQIDSVTIKITTKEGRIIEKYVDESNIMYAYRDKAVANETALVFGITGRKRYYQYFKNCMENKPLRAGILRCVAGYLPIIKLEDDE